MNGYIGTKRSPPVTLTERERIALDEFVIVYWSTFKSIASEYLDEGEMKSLSDKLRDTSTVDI
jgi:hypothetical protein